MNARMQYFNNKNFHQDNSFYNAMMLVDRQGRLRHIYRKHFLYETDKRWVTGPGPSFEFIDVEDTRFPGGKLRVHYICYLCTWLTRAYYQHDILMTPLSIYERLDLESVWT
jgi:hypothetical protein